MFALAMCRISFSLRKSPLLALVGSMPLSIQVILVRSFAQPHRFLPSVDAFVSLTVVSQSAPAFPEPSHCNLVNNLMETKGQLLRAKEEGRVLQEELVEQKKFASVSQESQERCVCVCVDMCKVFW